ncbi:MAG: NrfD/PsrC family molybdoenzyme membrane anchor subunit [Leptothrix ochracea]|uniref:NrfD/PsrC family molybdoenzyme membrane anchor subunit n=1 Tax=Leptothrix ochracea TaxID=735331 RepID=UPI0034E2364C
MFQRLQTSPRLELRAFFGLLALGGLVVLAGLWAAHGMEEHGHVITGMNNQIVWGLPHVFAIFMIVAASGVLNVASVGSVFGQPMYKARAPLSGLMSVALLAGGLMVLLLDLGRPERVIVAATNYNLRSMFAWNVVLYSGLFTLVAIYMWTMLERRMHRWSKPAGIAAFIWRFILTTGTGSIFGFLVARQAYQSAVLAPMFIVLSLAWGLALFLLAQWVVYRWNGRDLPEEVQRRLVRLLTVFISASLYLVAIYHGTNLYWARQAAFERFILLEGGGLTLLFWLGFVMVGSVLPLALLWLRSRCTMAVIVACLGVVLGALALLYVFIIGAQVYPLDIFPGFTLQSTFMDGQIDVYTPTLREALLGVGGLGMAFVLVVLGSRLFAVLPDDRHASV